MYSSFFWLTRLKQPDEQAYIMSAYKEDVPMKDADASDDEEEEVGKALPTRAESDESEDEGQILVKYLFAANVS
jgi:hypothetical protein